MWGKQGLQWTSERVNQTGLTGEWSIKYQVWFSRRKYEQVLIGGKFLARANGVRIDGFWRGKGSCDRISWFSVDTLCSCSEIKTKNKFHVGILQGSENRTASIIKIWIVICIRLQIPGVMQYFKEHHNAKRGPGKDSQNDYKPMETSYSAQSLLA